MITRPIAKLFPVFLLPITVAFLIGFVYPFLKGFYLSFCTFTTTSDAKFIGISNYIKAFQDATFVHAFGYTSLYTVVSLVLVNVLAFFLAALLTQKINCLGYIPF